MNIKADVDGSADGGQNDSSQNEDFGVKLEENGDPVQPIQALRLDCNEEEEEDEYDESLLFDDEGETDDISQAEDVEFKFEEAAMIEMVDEKDSEIGEVDFVTENEEDFEETEGDIASKPPALNLGLMNGEFDDEDGYTFIKLEDTKVNVLSEEKVERKTGKDDGKRHQRVHYEEDSEEEDCDPDLNSSNGSKPSKDDGKRHQRVHYEEDSEEEDDTSRDPDYNVEEEEGFTIRRKRVKTYFLEMFQKSFDI